MTGPHGPERAAYPARPVTPVGILASALDRLAPRLDRLATTEPKLAAELRGLRELACGLDPYTERCSTSESAALRALAERTRAHDWTRHAGGRVEQEMLSGQVEGQVLKMLVHACRARRVLEVGMFTGYSALAMAEALPETGELVACEIDAEVARFAGDCFRRSPHGHKIVVRVGPAQDTLAGLAAAGEVFDLIFVDADKSGYPGYLNTILDRGLLAGPGLLCVDNTLMQGLPWRSAAAVTSGEVNGRAIAGFNRALAADPRVEQVLVPLRDGLTLVRQV